MDTCRLIQTFKGDIDFSISIAFSPDGYIIASGSDDDTIYLLEAQTGKYLHSFIGHFMNVQDTVFSPDGKVLASSSDDGTVLLWDLTTSVLKR